MSPQGVLALLAIHSPHSTTQILGSTPTVVPIHQLSSPQPAQPKECIPFTTLSPSDNTIRLSGLPMHSIGHEYFSWGHRNF
jgi:hypothetical protein